MEVLFITFFFILGTMVGSFLNVVILRFNTGGGVSGRSRCFSCSRQIKWYDLVPVISFLMLGGVCRNCKSKISIQYPLVEFFTGLIFVLVFLKYETIFSAPHYLVVDLVAISLLIVIAVYDLRHKIIPDQIALLFGIIAIVKLFISYPFSFLASVPGLWYLFAGPILALPIFLLWILSRGRAIGLGDAKLALGIGWFFGLAYGLSALIIGFWIGAAVSLLLLASAKLMRMPAVTTALLNFGLKNLTMKSEIPLAPFLILGFLVVYFLGFDVLGLSNFGI